MTIEKYIRDVKAFSVYTQNTAVTKEIVIAYKKHLQENYAVRSINSMLASINSLFAFLGRHDLRVKSLKLQQQVFCPEEKELTKAEYARLCRTAERKHNERLNLILQTICGTGIRFIPLFAANALQSANFVLQYFCKFNLVMYSLQTMLSNIITLVHESGAKILCEGVENLEQADFLDKINCDMMQGFYFSKILPLVECEKFLKNENIKEGKNF